MQQCLETLQNSVFERYLWANLITLHLSEKLNSMWSIDVNLYNPQSQVHHCWVSTLPKFFWPFFVGQTFTFLKALFISNISLFTAQMAMFNFWKQISSALFIWIYLGLPYCLQLRQQNFGGGSSMGYIYLDPFSPGIKTLLSPIKYNKSEKSNFALWWWLLPGQAAKVSVMITNNSYSCWHKFTKRSI